MSLKEFSKCLHKGQSLSSIVFSGNYYWYTQMPLIFASLFCIQLLADSLKANNLLILIFFVDNYICKKIKQKREERWKKACFFLYNSHNSGFCLYVCLFILIYCSGLLVWLTFFVFFLILNGECLRFSIYWILMLNKHWNTLNAFFGNCIPNQINLITIKNMRFL